MISNIFSTYRLQVVCKMKRSRKIVINLITNLIFFFSEKRDLCHFRKKVARIKSYSQSRTSFRSFVHDNKRSIALSSDLLSSISIGKASNVLSVPASWKINRRSSAFPIFCPAEIGLVATAVRNWTDFIGNYFHHSPPGLNSNRFSCRPTRNC